MRSTHVLVLALVAIFSGSVRAQAEAPYEPHQRVVISDGYTSWLLKGSEADAERYGEGEALPRLLSEGWTISQVNPGCGEDSKTVYVLNRTAAASAARGKAH